MRDINRHLGWELPTDGPKTLNGLVIEELQNIPAGHTGIRMGNYIIETLTLTDKMIEKAKVKAV